MPNLPLLSQLPLQSRAGCRSNLSLRPRVVDRHGVAARFSALTC